MEDTKPFTVEGLYVGGSPFESRTKGEVDPDGKYSINVVIDDAEAAKVTEKLKAAAAAAKFKGKVVHWGVKVGDDEEKYPNTFEHHFISPKNNFKPRMIAKVAGEVVEVTKDSSPTIYPGCRVRVSLTAYALEGKGKSYGNSTSLSLRGVALLAEGTPLFGGGEGASDSEFGDFDSEIDTSML